MRLRDLLDYFRYRRFASNPWEIVRFRVRQSEGDALVVKLRGRPPLFIRGGMYDYHMFDRIYLRDEYRVRPIAEARCDCAVDLGANVGIFSARASEFARRVIAYEPFPDNQTQLRKNIERRGNVIAVQEAVAGRPGTIRIHRPAKDRQTGRYSAFLDMGALRSDAYVEVPAVTLDQVFRSHGIVRCDLLKIDVEGCEYDILGEASDETLSRIRRIHGEYHNVRPQDPKTRIDAFRAHLASKGFRVETISHRKMPNHGRFFAWREEA